MTKDNTMLAQRYNSGQGLILDQTVYLSELAFLFFVFLCCYFFPLLFLFFLFVCFTQKIKDLTKSCGIGIITHHYRYFDNIYRLKIFINVPFLRLAFVGWLICISREFSMASYPSLWILLPFHFLQVWASH